MSVKFGLIGGGIMGEALLSRLIVGNMYQAGEIIVSEPALERRQDLETQYGVVTCYNNQELLKKAKEVVLLAVKPQIFSAISQELWELASPNCSPTIISVMAGVRLSQLERAFPGCPVIRAMPNTPATVGAGITAICPGSYADTNSLKVAQTLLSVVGEVVEVPENLMDAVTGLSGSGPAYVALFVEALTDGGVAVGLPRAIAYKLALQTVLGSATLLAETKIHPAQLKDKVTSPGGTTIAGVAHLENAAFRSAAIGAVKSATERSKELGNG